MQYFGRAIGSVSKTWNSINPATLSGAIDVIVVENEDGELHCSPFHVRFGKFQLLRPSQKKVRFIVNGEVTDIPMKLTEEGEAFFVFETDGFVPKHLQTSPVVSAISSPTESPRIPPDNGDVNDSGNEEGMEFLDIGEGISDNAIPPPSQNEVESNVIQVPSEITPETLNSASTSSLNTNCMSPVERAKSITLKLNIPSRVEANGDIILDMNGYKSDNKDVQETDILVKHLLKEEFGDDVDVESLIKEFEGNIRIINPTSAQSMSPSPQPMSHSQSQPIMEASTPSSDVASNQSDTEVGDNGSTANKEVHFKTLRLTSEQLKCLPLSYGENDIQYNVDDGRSIIKCKLFLWKRSTPIVISDIDGTITKSDALGHVLTMFGKDWTHEGVAKLFDDIEFNGYNIMYLTARSVGLADTTRSYLRGIEQDGIKLPPGPVILSPDRTIAALRREIVLKKPEVFKMACLNDIRTLYYPDISDELEQERNNIFNEENADIYTEEHNDNGKSESLLNDEFSDVNTSTELGTVGGTAGHDHMNSIVNEMQTPFYAGFGNRITDAISYRSVGVPSSRIFTINPDGDVQLELLELAGYKSSYVSIVELVDQFFPPVELKSNALNTNIYDETLNSVKNNDTGRSKTTNDNYGTFMNNRNKYTEFNYWRSPDIDLSLISDEEEDEEKANGKGDVDNRLLDKNVTAESGSNSTGKISPKSHENDDHNDDEVKSVGSRFSFFLRSPISSPRKVSAGESGSSDNGDVKSFTDEVFQEEEGFRDDQHEEEEEDASDSDYIYETSDDDIDYEDEDGDDDDDDDQGNYEQEEEGDEDADVKSNGLSFSHESKRNSGSATTTANATVASVSVRGRFV